MTAKRVWGWRDSELRRMWANGVETAEIARVLQVPASAIEKRRRTLELTPRKGSCRTEAHKVHEWQPHEDRILRREWANGITIKCMLPMLPGRSHSSLSSRVETLRLKPRKAQGHVSKNVNVLMGDAMRDELSRRAQKRGVSRAMYIKFVLEYFLDGQFELPERMMSNLIRPGTDRHKAAKLAEKGLTKKQVTSDLLASGITQTSVHNCIAWLDKHAWPWPLDLQLVAAE